MELIKWEPVNEIERFFGDRAFPSIHQMGWDLAVDVYEEDGNVVAKMNLPGINPDEITISVDEDTLTISGMREEEKEVDEKNYYSREIRRGSFSRVVDLPKSVNPHNTEAEYKDGVLKIGMPIVKGKNGKAVEVRVKK